MLRYLLQGVCGRRPVVKIEAFKLMVDNCGTWDKVFKNLHTTRTEVDQHEDQGWIDAASWSHQ